MWKSDQSIFHTSALGNPPLQDTVVHHFVTSIDDAMLMSSSAEPLDDSVYNGPYKLPFILPSDSFSLCYYTSQGPNRAIRVQSYDIANWICPKRRAYWFGSWLYFRIPDFTLTGCYVDQHPVQILVPGKPKCCILRTSFFQLLHLEFQSTST